MDKLRNSCASPETISEAIQETLRLAATSPPRNPGVGGSISSKLNQLISEFTTAISTHIDFNSHSTPSDSPYLG